MLGFLKTNELMTHMTSRSDARVNPFMYFKLAFRSLPFMQLHRKSLLHAGNRRHRDAGAAVVLRPALR